ncbi:MAG: hypothetical protein AB7F89_16325 [Pirellulaceae bacterium]
MSSLTAVYDACGRVWASQKAARVEIVVTLGGNPEKPGIGPWRLAGGQWYYQETLK